MSVFIVGVDGSETAMHAAQTAARFAAAMGAQLHVITAFSPDMGDTPTSPRQMRSEPDLEAEGLAASVAQDLRAVTPHVTSAGVVGRPAEALVKSAEDMAANLIFVGNRRVQSSVGRVLGSIATAVAHGAPCDVYIVHTNR